LIVPLPAAEPFGATYQRAPVVAIDVAAVTGTDAAVETTTSSEAPFCVRLWLARIAAEPGEVTSRVVTGKVAEVAPTGTVTLSGTDASLGLKLWRLTTAPEPIAGPLSVTLPVAEPPPTTLFGAIVMLVMMSGRTVRVAALVTSPVDATISTGPDVVTSCVVMEKDAVAAPSGTVTWPGTVARLVFPLAR
jgi:hypothetical protein